jgi:hypothetical protein
LRVDNRPASDSELLSIALFRATFEAERHCSRFIAPLIQKLRRIFNMKSHAFSAPALFLAALVSLFLPGIAAAQNEIAAGTERPMFTRLRPTLHSPKNITEATTAPLQIWNGNFIYHSKTYNYNMVGVAPSTNSSATITTYLIPVKLVLSNGKSYT